MSHKEKAIEIGKKSVNEGWTADETIKAIHSLILEVGYELSSEIQSSLAQGIMTAAREIRESKNEK